MIINIRDYVDRWMNDYIVYHASHLRGYGDLSYGALYFDQKYLELIGLMGDAAMQGLLDTIIANMRTQGGKAASGLKVLSDIQSGNLLETILDKIAQGINEGIELYQDSINGDNYETILLSAKGFNKALARGPMSASAVNQFFDLLLKGIELAGHFNIDLLDGLTDIGKHLSNNPDFAIDSSWTKKVSRTLTFDDVLMALKIIEMLTRAADKLSTNGSLDPLSFSSTINNIFSTVIGERISKKLIANGIKTAISTGDTILDDMTKQPLGKGKLTWNNRSRFTLGGMKHDAERRVSKVDIFNLKAFVLSVSENGQTYDIEIGTNTSVKWYKKVNLDSQIHMVAGTPLGSYFKSGTPEHYLAYNILAHRFSGEAGSDFHEAYRSLRAATAATFFTEWMAGTGTAIMTKSGNISKSFNNRVLFLMINGKVYSVMRIIRNICNELARNNSWTESKDMPFNMSITNKAVNKWVGDGPNISEAMIRSLLVNAVMDTLTISASLNGNILTKYAY